MTREVLDDYSLPEGQQQIVKVTASRGNNLHEVQTAKGDQFLVSMPTRFRKNVWIKRGDFVIVDPIQEGDKVKAEIASILYPKQIKYIQQESLWPAQFTKKTSSSDLDTDGEQGGDLSTDTLTKDISKISLRDAVSRPGDGGDDEDDDDGESDSDNDDDLFVNTNRPTVTYFYSDSEEEDEEDNEER